MGDLFKLLRTRLVSSKLLSTKCYKNKNVTRCRDSRSAKSTETR